MVNYVFGLTKPLKSKSTHLFILMVALFAMGCKKAPTTAISPARNISGTWVATANVNVYELSNCTSAGSFYTYATFPSIFTFQISQVNDTTVQVQVSSSAKSGKADSCSETPPIENTGQVVFGGIVSSSALTLTDYIYGMTTTGVIEYANFDVGDFSFTSNILSGKIYWVQYYSSFNAIGWSTDKITLMKK